MPTYTKLTLFILNHEGGCACVEGDAGGFTCSGVTLSTFRDFYGQEMKEEDLRNMTYEQWTGIFITGFWNKLKCDNIKDWRIAYLLCDWAWHSGVKTAGKAIQRIVGVEADGVIGKKTLAAINSWNGERLFYRLYNSRQTFLYKLIESKQNNRKFELGWMRRMFELYTLCFNNRREGY